MKAVAQMVPAGHVAADVGCDHGFVSVYLVRNGVCPFVYAADVRPGPLAGAAAHIRENGLADAIVTVLSDGLENVPVGRAADRPVPKEMRGESGGVRREASDVAGRNGMPGADVMIAAGMGGKLTIRILERCPEKTAQLSWLVLEPQSEIWLVRSWLDRNGFVITDEAMVSEDGRYYPVIQAGNGRLEEAVLEKGITLRKSVCTALARTGLGEQDCRQACDRFGPVLIARKDAVLLSFLEHTMEKDAALLEGMPRTAENLFKAGRIEMRRRELADRIVLEQAVAGLCRDKKKPPKA